ncbi:MAG TPA: bifunctional histidinol-phosphatase/imidazoleglycerol-phosphate dehydratase HisB [Opitutaceae bacterium]|nr:bifunctional histidinol-phosphatase/imidazoleglycerol-phosphate dehydratase HisB [Opitutaceae bacterium]
MRKILFIDRDGVLIGEPEDKQIDTLDKFSLEPGVVQALTRLRDAGYRFVMVSNQDGLGTESFPEEQFRPLQDLLLRVLASQGIEFEAVRVCPHTPADGCECRKPRVGLVLDYLRATDWDRAAARMIGDRETDMEFAGSLGVAGIRYNRDTLGWSDIARLIVETPRRGTIARKTRETQINVSVDLDATGPCAFDTGIGFFDHMLDQIARNAGISIQVQCKGDLKVDEHHTVEDVALAIGATLRQAIGDKRGIGRYGFVLPMDDARAEVAVDLSGRAWLVFEGKFPREAVGTLPTELVEHFFHSLADSLGATVHMRVKGENTHHMIEALFKAFGRALRPALARTAGGDVPSTKGVL